MTTVDERIAKLEEKLKQAKAQKARIEARKRTAERKRARQQDTRRKILVGAAILAKVERGDWPREKLLAMMDTVLTRPDDRALFDLPAPIEEPAFLEDEGPSDELPYRITLR
ncbi:mobilization protein [Marichromatium bheemlicum]|uniref:Mobilization protein n=1 Tax=Marichromatium bheemlicum TaxID=365339 RepID=A0ABX1IEF7_9GAMM|nr:mobilization protein [Marichromatium bheemlicum]NKN34705.1 mobilization protein [Marichromatium bheemlicum]